MSAEGKIMENKRIVKYVMITGVEKRKRKISQKKLQVTSESFMNEVSELKKDFKDINVIQISSFNAWDSGEMTFQDLFAFNTEIIYKKKA